MRWIKTETVNIRLLVPSALTVAAGVGAAVGYVVASRIQEKKFREIADAEIEEAKVYYQNLYSRPPLIVESDEKPKEERIVNAPTWEELVPQDRERMMQDAVEALQEYSPPEGDPRPAPTGPAPTVVNIFTNHTAPGEEVLEALLADRDPEFPYIVTRQEYLENDPDHEQWPFTYYEGDGVLVDDREEYYPIDDIDKVVGEENLMRFGYGSGDENVLYIRNESVSPPLDMCITRSVGKYAEEVMRIGEEDTEIKHSRKQKRFRLNDD